jgi:hypothetical protein
MRSDLFLFFGILIFIFVVWVATGGPSRPISFAGPYITPITAPGGTGTGYSLKSGGGTSNTASPQHVQQSVNQIEQNVINLQKSLAEAAHFGTPSVYKGLVTIRHSVGSLLTNDPQKEYVTIAASGRATTGIDITGWRIQSEAVGHSLRIPEGVSLPHSAIVNQTEPIVLSAGQSAIITTGDSPVGMSFRENLCTGYFDQFQNFTPSLPHLCPLPQSDFTRFYLGNQHSYDACLAYVKTVQRCIIPLDTPSNLSTDCNRFIDTNLNYNGCVAQHTADPNFFGNTWRIYLGQDDQFFTKTHDTIKLLDSSGNTVDLLSY